MDHRTTEAIEEGLDAIRSCPPDGGRVELIVSRPETGERASLDRAELTCEHGLVGDTWRPRAEAKGLVDPARQITIMNARAAALFAGDRERWPLAGDQLYVDLDISEDNLPTGMRLSVGGAVVEISEEPHTGCAKFAERFGMDAARFVNTAVGRQLRLRGLNARVVQPGAVSVGDVVTKCE